MTLSTTVRNAMATAYVSTVGNSPIIRIFQGTMPAATTDADAGTKLVEFDDLPSTWMSAPSNGTISKTGSWPQETAIASGTAQYWRLYNSTGTTCHDQGTVYQTGDSPDPGETMEIRKKSITLGDPIEVVTFSLTMPVN